MIIQLNLAEHSNKAATFLEQHPPVEKNKPDTLCFMIDIEQHVFTNQILPAQMAEQLINAGLPAAVKDIYLLVSEINPQHSLIAFAHNLAQCFVINYQRNIQVHVPAYLSSAMTFLVPPNQENEWAIYGVASDNVPIDATYVSFDAIQNKKLIWKGKNILDWMNSPQQTLDGVTYAWEGGAIDEIKT